jgi:tetratricopeptide (TPR) repeat protein
MSRFLVKVVVLGALLFFFALAGTGGYAIYSWHTAKKEVAEYRIEEAKQHLRFCLFLRPNNIAVNLLAARAARLDGEFDEAEKHLSKCLKLAKGSTEEIQVEYLLMRVQRGEEDEVAPELLQYVEGGYAESKLILETLAHAYMRNMRSGMAFTCLSMRIDLDPGDYQPYEWRGWVLEKLNDWGGAIKDYAKALDLNPKLTSARLRLAELQLEHTNIEEAAANLELLASQFPDRADVKARLGQCRFVQGDSESARPLLEAAVKELPNDSPLLIHLSKLEMQSQNWTQAEHWLRHALEIDPTDLEARFNLVGCLEHAGKRKEADAERERHRNDSAVLLRVSKILQTDAEHPSRDPDALYEVGSVFLMVNNTRVGLWWLNRVLKLNPNHQATHKTLAEYYEKKGDKELAAQHRRQIKPAK